MQSSPVRRLILSTKERRRQGLLQNEERKHKKRRLTLPDDLEETTDEEPPGENNVHEEEETHEPNEGKTLNITGSGEISGKALEEKEIENSQQKEDATEIDWALFDEFDSHFLRKYCEDEGIYVPPFPHRKEGGSSTTTLSCGHIKQHYLAAIYKHIIGNREPKEIVSENSAARREKRLEDSNGASQRIEDPNSLQSQEQKQGKASPTISQRAASQQLPTKQKEEKQSKRKSGMKGKMTQDRNAKSKEIQLHKGKSEEKKHKPAIGLNVGDRTSSQKGSKSAEGEVLHKKWVLNQQQEAVWVHLSSGEKRDLEYIMDNNWTWIFYRRKGMLILQFSKES